MLKSIKLSTKGNTDIIDITDKVKEFLKESKIKQGIINIFSRHTTASVSIIEYEKGVMQDLKKAFEKIAPLNQEYSHNKLRNDDNGCSHVKASMLGSSVNIPFENNKLLLGTWQSIVFIDFDLHPRRREVILNIIETR